MKRQDGFIADCEGLIKNAEKRSAEMTFENFQMYNLGSTIQSTDIVPQECRQELEAFTTIHTER